MLAADIPLTSGVRAGLLAVVTAFACVEKLCSILNLVSVEKDWVSQLIVPIPLFTVVLIQVTR